METKVCTRKDCPHKGEPQPLASFNRDKRARDGRASECKSCHYAMVVRWRELHPERCRELGSSYQKQITPEGVQRGTIYMRTYRARLRAERGAQ